MRNIATIMLAAVMLPALAADQSPTTGLAPSTEVAGEPSRTEADAPPNYVSNYFLKKTQINPNSLSSKEAEAMALFARAAIARGSPRCYFIRQVNGNLQKPKDKPELLPLAAPGAAPISNSKVTCPSDSMVRPVSSYVR